MLLTFVCIYILISVGIGFYVSTKVKNTRDFAIAGRHLPLPVVIATVFAGNSLKFTEQGVVVIRLDAPSHDRLRLQVEDTGIGMSSEEVACIFDKFAQADSSITRRFGGTT